MVEPFGLGGTKFRTPDIDGEMLKGGVRKPMIRRGSIVYSGGWRSCGDFRIKVKALILLVLFVAAVPTATRVIDVTGYWVLLVPPALLIASISLLKFEKGILLWGPRDARKECDATLEAPKYDLRKLY